MKVSKERLTQIVTEELKRSQKKERGLMTEDLSPLIITWLLIAYILGQQAGGDSVGYSSYESWDQRSMWQKFKDKRFLKKMNKMFTPETVELIYNKIIEKDDTGAMAHPNLFKMIKSNKDRYSGSEQLRKAGLIDQEDDNILQRVFMMVKKHHQVKKKEAKKAKRDAYYANLRPMDLGDQENENI